MLAFLALLSVLPDFDFALVWGLGLPLEQVHRTWSHSLFFALFLTLVWVVVRPGRLKSVSGFLFFSVLISHSLLDLLCTADPSSHGIMLLWPFSQIRLGWPVLVPLYLEFADSPFTLSGALRFTWLELWLSLPLWISARGLSRLIRRTPQPAAGG